MALESNNDNNLKKEILRECDRLRDVTLPAIGLEILDSKTGNNNKDTSSNWRFIAPRKTEESPDDNDTDSKEDQDNSNAISQLSLDMLFRVGKYKGVFLDYDDSGMPYTMADGSPLSKAL